MVLLLIFSHKTKIKPKMSLGTKVRGGRLTFVRWLLLRDKYLPGRVKRIASIPLTRTHKEETRSTIRKPFGTSIADLRHQGSTGEAHRLHCFGSMCDWVGFELLRTFLRLADLWKS